MRTAILAAIALAAPTAASAAAPPRDGLSRARIGQEVFVGGPRVKPVAVLEDSRCPARVVCVWAGRLRLAVEIRTGRGRERREMVLGQAIRVADGTLLLAQALPLRTPEAAVRPGDYRFGFRFDGGL